jgi:quaternary ammonium compound-resistance protein SugE
MAWLIIIVAGLFEIVWAVAMKQSQGFTRLVPSVVTMAAMFVSFALLAWAMRVLPLGTAYMVWTAVGALGTFIVGVVWMGEPLGLVRVAAAVLIVSGVVLMKVSSSV